MSYIALYREWRPKYFREIMGQEHITRTLQNQIKQGRVAHAYLFCGTRGTGKTTTAKVFARSINCLHPEDGEPCGKCEICTGIDSGNIMDIAEIDAASNNGVDNIRELRDDVKYLPSKCKYKVYIIDEVHMLSTSAFNALLKTLEEPPSYIVFILATTEYHKVPATILSRCQRFDFKRISMDDMIIRLNEIANENNVGIDDKTLRLIARSADGAMRDALSIFDQCISLGGNSVNYQDVASVLGITTDEYLLKLTDAVALSDTSKCIALIDELITNGKDVYQFIKDLTMHFRNLLICRMGDTAINIVSVSEEMFEEFKNQTKKFSTEGILRNINILSSAEADAKWSSQPRIIMEMALFRMCNKELAPDVDVLIERVARLEKMVTEKGIYTTQISSATQQETYKEDTVNPKKDTSAVKIDEHKAAVDISLKEISKKWKDIINAVKINKKLYSNVFEAKPINITDDLLTIGFSYEFNKKAVEDPENIKILEDKILSVCGSRLKINCTVIKNEVAVDKQEKEDDEIVNKAISIFGKDIVEVEEQYTLMLK